MIVPSISSGCWKFIKVTDRWNNLAYLHSSSLKKEVGDRTFIADNFSINNRSFFFVKCALYGGPSTAKFADGLWVWSSLYLKAIVNVLLHMHTHFCRDVNL